jgi:hypothetical protein
MVIINIIILNTMMDSPKKKRQKHAAGEIKHCKVRGCDLIVQVSYDKCYYHNNGHICSVGNCQYFALPPMRKCKVHRGFCPKKDCRGKAQLPTGYCKKHTESAKCLEEGCENVGVYFKWCPAHSVRCSRVRDHFDVEEPPVADVQLECEKPMCVKCYNRILKANSSVTTS